MINPNPMIMTDYYKQFHMEQYAEGTEFVYSPWTPRSNKYFPKSNRVAVFGVQYVVQKFLIDTFNEFFFRVDEDEAVADFAEYLSYPLNKENPKVDHVRALHRLGYLPVKIKALKEGTTVPIRVPVMTIENTKPEFFWLTNFLETLISSVIWLPMTSATIAHTYRKILDEYALKTTGSTEGVDFQGHDFSMRGMASPDASMTSGAGHLLSFLGSDTIPAIWFLRNYYKANIRKEIIGTSIPATEHSVMCSYGKTNEFDLFKRLITETYPDGFFSVVSDTWDFWKVIREYLPKLKNEIMNRDGRVVIRPDSGDPVLILTGDESSNDPIVKKGLIEALWDIFGGTVNELGYKVLDPHIGAIYGDSITLDRAEAICERLEEKGFASTNVVLGIGSYTYQYNTRDTFGFALKATYAVVNGEERLLFKDPKTDDGTKKSLKGLVAVIEKDGDLVAVDGLNREEYEKYKDTDMLEEVFVDGELVREQSLSEIREILKQQK